MKLRIAVLAFFCVVASSQIFPHVFNHNLFRLQRYYNKVEYQPHRHPKFSSIIKFESHSCDKIGYQQPENKPLFLTSIHQNKALTQIYFNYLCKNTKNWYLCVLLLHKLLIIGNICN